MKIKQETIQTILIVFVLLVAVLGIGIQAGLSYSGEYGTLNEDGTAEIRELNTTGIKAEWIELGGDNQTLWPNGTVYDQSLNTTDDVTFANIDSSGYFNGTEFYLDSDNRTQVLEGDFTNGIGVQTDWLELGGDNRTAWPSDGGGYNTTGPYTFIIYKDGSTYRAEYNNGTEAFSGLNCTFITEWALGNMTTGGILQYDIGEFEIPSQINFDGGGGDYQYIVQGMGMDSTSLKTTSGSAIYQWKINNKPNMIFRAMTFDCNYRGGAIYGASDGSSEMGLFRGGFYNVRFRRMHQNLYGLNLENFHHCKSGTMLFDCDGATGKGMLLNNTSSTTNYGNSDFYKIKMRVGGAVDGIVIVSHNHRMNLITFGHLEIHYGGAGSTMIKIDGDHIHVYYLISETGDGVTNVLIESGYANSFYGGYISSYETAFNISSSAYETVIGWGGGFRYYGRDNSTALLFADYNTDSSQPTIVCNLFRGAGELANPSYINTTATRFAGMVNGTWYGN